MTTTATPVDVSESARRLTIGLVLREESAERELLERFTGHVERVLLRITGDASDLDDRVQDVFLRVIDRVDTLRDPASLPAFVTQVAVNVGREALRSRRRRRWLTFLAPADLPEHAAPTAGDRVLHTVDALYKAIDALDGEARIAFVLRHIEGMELGEVAAACGKSLATIKRRLAEAERTFSECARRSAELQPWLEGSRKWQTKT